MTKTILITGASSGIGLATANYFYENGWNVVAAIIFKAATDSKDTLRYVVGKDAKQIAFFRRYFGYKRIMKMTAKRFQITAPNEKR